MPSSPFDPAVRAPLTIARGLRFIPIRLPNTEGNGCVKRLVPNRRCQITGRLHSATNDLATRLLGAPRRGGVIQSRTGGTHLLLRTRRARGFLHICQTGVNSHGDAETAYLRHQ